MTVLTDNPNMSDNENVEEVDTDSVDGVHNVDESTDLGNYVAEGAEDAVIVDVDSPDVTVNVAIETPETDGADDDASSTDLVILGQSIIDAINSGFAALSEQIHSVGMVAAEAAVAAETAVEMEVAEEVAEEVEADEPPESARAHWFFR